MTARKLVSDGLSMMGVCLVVFLCIAFGLVVIVVVETLTLAGRIFTLPMRWLGGDGK